MKDKPQSVVWPIVFWQLVFWFFTCGLIAVNLIGAGWHWRANRKLQLQQEVARLSALTGDRYETEVRDVRRLAAMAHWVRDREDFLVNSGDAIVSQVFAPRSASNQDRSDDQQDQHTVRVIVYIPPGNHRLKYSYLEVWDERQRSLLRGNHGYSPQNKDGWEMNAVTLDVPTGEVYECAFSVEQQGEETMLRVAVTGQEERTFALRPGDVVRHKSNYFDIFKTSYPNQHVSAFDEIDNNSDVWHRRENVRNELLFHRITMRSRREVNNGRPKEESLRLLCWIESDVPASASALLVAAYSKKFIDRQRITRKAEGGNIGAIGGPVPSVDDLFQPYDNSGNLYYRIPPEDY